MTTATDDLDNAIKEGRRIARELGFVRGCIRASQLARSLGSYELASKINEIMMNDALAHVSPFKEDEEATRSRNMGSIKIAPLRL